MNRASLIFNPAAGHRSVEKIARQAAAAIRKLDWTVSLHGSLSGEHLTQLAFQAVEEDADLLVLFGGDGSINCVLPPLIGSRTALGIVPVGSSNVFYKELGLPRLDFSRRGEIEAYIHRLAEGETIQVDVGMCNGKPFLLWAGIGIDAKIVHSLEPRGRFGKRFTVLQYAAQALWTASYWKGIRLNVQDGVASLEGANAILTVACNGRLYAGGAMKFCDDALLDDGEMELYILEGRHVAHTLGFVRDVWLGGLLRNQKVQRLKFREINIASQTPLLLQLDGEPKFGQHNIQLGVLPAAIKVKVPRRQAAAKGG